MRFDRSPQQFFQFFFSQTQRQVGARSLDNPAQQVRLPSEAIRDRVRVIHRNQDRIKYRPFQTTAFPPRPNTPFAGYPCSGGAVRPAFPLIHAGT